MTSLSSITQDLWGCPMKTFDCVKTVSAGRIVFVGEVVLGLEGGCDVIVGDDFIAKHRPVVGGYYVKYEDGYASYSPASAGMSSLGC